MPCGDDVFSCIVSCVCCAARLLLQQSGAADTTPTAASAEAAPTHNPCGFGGGGALCVQSLSSTFAIRDSTFEDNKAVFGGKLMIEYNLSVQ